MFPVRSEYQVYMFVATFFLQLKYIFLQESFKQRTVGRTKDGVNFPVATRLQLASDVSSAYDIQIWVSTFIKNTTMDQYNKIHTQ